MILDRVSYSRLVDNLNDGLYIVDGDRIIQYWNKAAERISGHTAADLIGKPCSDNVLAHMWMAMAMVYAMDVSSVMTIY